MSEILALIRVFSYLSILTVGGGMAAFPELKVLTVEVHKWLTFAQLIHIYSVGQMAPGPNMMMIVVIGQWTAGITGAIVTLVAFFGPTALLAFIIAKAWRKLEHWPWRTSIQQGLAPVSIGLLLAGCFSMAKGAITGLEQRDCRGDAVDPVAVQDQPGTTGGRWGSGRSAEFPAEIEQRRGCATTPPRLARKQKAGAERPGWLEFGSDYTPSLRRKAPATASTPVPSITSVPGSGTVDWMLTSSR